MRATILGLNVHPDAELFPLMKGEAFEELVVSIRKHGLREKIKLLDGQILDGRNRARALARPDAGQTGRLDVPLRKGRYAEDVVLDGMTPAEFVAVENVHRRHLTAAQRKSLAGKLAVRIKKEQAAKPKSEKVDALQKAATVAGVSRRTAATAVAEIEGRTPPKITRSTAVIPAPEPEPVDAEWTEVEPKVSKKAAKTEGVAFRVEMSFAGTQTVWVIAKNEEDAERTALTSDLEDGEVEVFDFEVQGVKALGTRRRPAA